MKTTAAFAAICTAAVLFAAPALAQSCNLQRLATLPLSFNAPDGIAVPVKISGRDYTMAVELGTPETAVGTGVVRDLKLRTHALKGAFTYYGAIASREVSLPTLAIGGQFGDRLPAIVVPSENLPAGTDGVLGSRLLANSDVDLDFAGGKMNLFSAAHCAGGVVYWSDTAAVVPFALNDMNRIVFHMTLDGSDVSVAFAVGAASTMRLQAAYSVFGDSAHRRINSRHPFKTLAVGGLAISNPAIGIVDDVTDPSCNGEFREPSCFSRTDVELGLATLKQLHIYVAFAEKKLYITGADAHK
jgi:hypothetical protein